MVALALAGACANFRRHLPYGRMVRCVLYALLAWVLVGLPVGVVLGRLLRSR